MFLINPYPSLVFLNDPNAIPVFLNLEYIKYFLTSRNEAPYAAPDPVPDPIPYVPSVPTRAGTVTPPISGSGINRL
jgi:hypothetical protein